MQPALGARAARARWYRIRQISLLCALAYGLVSAVAGTAADAQGDPGLAREIEQTRELSSEVSKAVRRVQAENLKLRSTLRRGAQKLTGGDITATTLRLARLDADTARLYFTTLDNRIAQREAALSLLGADIEQRAAALQGTPADPPAPQAAAAELQELRALHAFGSDLLEGLRKLRKAEFERSALTEEWLALLRSRAELRVIRESEGFDRDPRAVALQAIVGRLGRDALRLDNEAGGARPQVAPDPARQGLLRLEAGNAVIRSSVRLADLALLRFEDQLDFYDDLVDDPSIPVPILEDALVELAHHRGELEARLAALDEDRVALEGQRELIRAHAASVDECRRLAVGPGAGSGRAPRLPASRHPAGAAAHGRHGGHARHRDRPSGVRGARPASRSAGERRPLAAGQTRADGTAASDGRLLARGGLRAHHPAGRPSHARSGGPRARDARGGRRLLVALARRVAAGRAARSRGTRPASAIPLEALRRSLPGLLPAVLWLLAAWSVGLASRPTWLLGSALGLWPLVGFVLRVSRSAGATPHRLRRGIRSPAWLRPILVAAAALGALVLLVSAAPMLPSVADLAGRIGFIAVALAAIGAWLLRDQLPGALPDQAAVPALGQRLLAGASFAVPTLLLLAAVLGIAGWTNFGWAIAGLVGAILAVAGLALLLCGILRDLARALERRYGGTAEDGAPGRSETIQASYRLAVVMVIVGAAWLLASLYVRGSAATATFWFVAVACALPFVLQPVQTLVAAFLRIDPERRPDGSISVLAICIDRGIRALLIIGSVLALAWALGFDLVALATGDTLATRIVRAVFNVGAVLLVADFVWHLARTAIDSRLQVAPALDAIRGRRGAPPGAAAHAAADPAQRPAGGDRRDRPADGPVLDRRPDRAAAGRRRRGRRRGRLRRADPRAGRLLGHVLPARRRVPGRRVHPERQLQGHGRGVLAALDQAQAPPRGVVHGAVWRARRGAEHEPRLGDRQAERRA